MNIPFTRLRCVLWHKLGETNNQGIQSLVIILYILKNDMLKLVVTMQGEITCWSGVKCLSYNLLKR